MTTLTYFIKSKKDGSLLKDRETGEIINIASWPVAIVLAGNDYELIPHYEERHTY